MHLDESIGKALVRAQSLCDRGNECIVDEATDLAAIDLEEAESRAKGTWVENHGLVDGDGRAQCSFHY